MNESTDKRPPCDGVWVKREDAPKGLDSAKSLSDIAWYHRQEGWNFGLTSQDVQYWVRISD